MKKLLSFFIAGAAIAALSATLTACNEPKDPNAPDLQEGVEVPFAEYSFEEGIPGETVSVRWINLNENDKATILIINSDKELKEHIEGDHPPVDFAKKTILLAHGPTTRGFHKAEVENFSHTSDKKYRLDVTAFLDDTTVIDRWHVAIVTDKIERGCEIDINIQFPDTWPE